MKFIVTKQKPDIYEADTAYLIKGSLHHNRYDDSWNDYSYRTIYTLQYCEIPQNVVDVGCVKVGEFNMSDGQFSPNLPTAFEKLGGEKFFSLGCEESYYKKLAAFEQEKGYDILLKLNDFTVCREVYEKAKSENVTKLSLLRSVSQADYDNYINRFYILLEPPVNLATMRRIFGSTGWKDVDSGLVEMQRLLFNANIHFYYNAIATIGREILKGIAGSIYNDELHRDKIRFPNPPGEDKYINKLHSVIDYVYGEKDISENIKDYIKSTITLVQGYVHKEKAESFECFMCVHAVVSLVFQLSIICNSDKYKR